MTVHDRVEMNPKIMLGKQVIRGTRIPAADSLAHEEVVLSVAG
jgi:uncharacterized protein (DUF433 family)